MEPMQEGPTPPSAIRAHVITDHAALRRLMTALAHETTHARQGAPDGMLRLRQALAALHDAFEAHLTYEERELVPLLADGDAWGPVRMTHVHDEHVAQRASFVALIEDAADGGKPLAEVADEIGWLIRGLMRDMDEEESKLFDGSGLKRDASA